MPNTSINLLLNQYKASRHAIPRERFDLARNDCIDGYVIQSVCGSGSSSDVYRVTFAGNESTSYALKILTRTEIVYQQAFRREIHLLDAIDFPGVTRIITSGVWKNKPYYVMPYYEPLPKHPPSEVIYKWVLELCNTVDYLSSKGIIHCDIKPTNVLWNAATQLPIIVDFGAARLTAAEHDSLALKAKANAPELIDIRLPRDDTPCSTAADVYSIAHFAHTLLSPTARQESPWRNVLPKALCAEADLRHQTAAAFAVDLKREA